MKKYSGMKVASSCYIFLEINFWPFSGPTKHRLMATLNMISVDLDFKIIFKFEYSFEYLIIAESDQIT
jgi:hypothetical protein